MKQQQTLTKSQSERAADELLDMEQAIALLNTTRPTFYRWLRAGKIKGMKAGRQWRFYRSDVERFRSPDCQAGGGRRKKEWRRHRRTGRHGREPDDSAGPGNARHRFSSRITNRRTGLPTAPAVPGGRSVTHSGNCRHPVVAGHHRAVETSGGLRCNREKFAARWPHRAGSGEPAAGYAG